jgi:hypothetical protein
MEEDKFYILCPDNSVTNEMDWKRLMWNARDTVEERPALSRWRNEYEEDFKKWMEGESL